MKEKEIEDKLEKNLNIESGLLAAQEPSKSAKAVCKFFNLEIKNIYKERTPIKKEESSNLKMPNKEELIDFIEKRDNMVNFSMIAKQFCIKNNTVSDLISLFEKKKLVSLKKLGGSKIVMVPKK